MTIKLSADESNIIDIVDESGFVTYPMLTQNEIAEIKTRISDQLITNIRIESETVADELSKSQDPLTEYSSIVDEELHRIVMPKTKRIFTPQTSQLFENMTGFQDLAQKIRLKGISDEESLGRPNYYWRLVRPMSASDIGPPHRDSWFWQLNSNYVMPFTNARRIKVWVPLIVDPHKNGLMISPNSHLNHNISWHGELRHGINKPVLDTDPASLDLQMIPTLEGQAIIFHDELLHAGSINSSNVARVSFEYTMFVANTK